MFISLSCSLLAVLILTQPLGVVTGHSSSFVTFVTFVAFVTFVTFVAFVTFVTFVLPWLAGSGSCSLVVLLSCGRVVLESCICVVL